MKIEHLLLEDRADYFAQQFNQQLVDRYKKDTGQDMQDPREVVNKLIAADPSRNTKYLGWISKMYVMGQFKMEDVSRINTELKEFERVKSKLQNKDILQYRTLPDLYKALAPYQHEEVLSNNQENDAQRTRMYAEADVIHKGSDYTLISPRTVEAAKYFGRGTKWCTSAEKDNAWDQYKSAPLYILMDHQGNKFQMWFPSEESESGQGAQVMDAQDQGVDLLKLFDTYKGLEKIMFESTSLKDFANPNDPAKALEFAQSFLSERWPAGEPAIMKDPMIAAKYAKLYVGRWPEAEPVIMKDPQAAIFYARWVLKKRWPAAEPNIMKNSKYAVEYAVDVIKGRWPEAEPSIKGHPDDADDYQNEILGGAEWPEPKEEPKKEKQAA